MMVEELAVERSDETGRSGSKPKDARIRTVSSSSTGYKLTKPRPGNRIDKLHSEDIANNIPLQNPFTIFDVNGFDGATAEKKKKPTRQKKFHPVLSLNCLFSENRILGRPIVPLGILNVRYYKASKMLGEGAADSQVDCGMDVGGKKSDSPSTSTGSASPRQSMECRGKRHKRRSKRHGRGKERTGKWKRGKWHVVERKGRRRGSKKQLVEGSDCGRRNDVIPDNQQQRNSH
ncbi:hypothetical protein CAEBREN_25398 [Caenorhabditis brenneri]|uniref:Uncharacterized protein n=1 Tax=Caenorhabditis brenneri TaxID=135651 RepID=G0NER0_CAEBE|nr:hypothetical protein CAEBREN_25398 [Caenorhabditis brenneri]